MLRPRLIPCLLLKKRGLVKTVRFATPKYVGDPINAVRLFNEKEVDELIVLDIDATVQRYEPDFALIAKLASECRMPFCYGGGISRVDQIERLVSLGVEKVAVSSAAVARPELPCIAAERVGAQSIVLVLDVRRSDKRDGYEIFTHNGSRPTGMCPTEFASRIGSEGVGEIVINSIDRDGMMEGYDMELVRRIRAATTLPITVLGGAGSLEHAADLIQTFGIIGAAAGSLFVFKGRHRAVLINYPTRVEKDALIARTLRGLP